MHILHQNTCKDLPHGTYVTPEGYFWKPKDSRQTVKLGESRKEATQGYLRWIANRKQTKKQKIKHDSRMSRAKHQLFGSMMARAREKDTRALTKDEFNAIWNRANGRCEITGIRFGFYEGSIGGRRPWSPSLDRIDSSKGYTPDNCRLVCTCVNLAMSEWPDDVFLRMCRAVAKRNPA